MLKHFRFNLDGGIWVFGQVLLGILAALTNAFFTVGKPGTTLLDNLAFDAQVDQISHA